MLIDQACRLGVYIRGLYCHTFSCGEDLTCRLVILNVSHLSHMVKKRIKEDYTWRFVSLFLVFWLFFSLSLFFFYFLLILFISCIKEFLGAKYVKKGCHECQLLIFILGQAKLAVYMSRKSQIEQMFGQNVIVLFSALLKALIDFNFCKSIVDLFWIEII